MENKVVTFEVFQLREVNIHDHALVRGYHINEPCMVELESAPMGIYLLCSKQGCLQLNATFIPHSLELCAGEAIFLAFPKNAWQLKIHAKPGAIFYTVKMDVGHFHTLINPSFDHQQIDTAKRMNMKDLMRFIPVNPVLMGCFDQLLHHKIKPPFLALFEKAKFLEIFSQIMESSFGQPLEACPVVISPAIEIKLGQVRRYIIEHIDEVPDPDQLAVQFDLPRNTLREGFRFLYGSTLHQFHADYKLESAMQMLTSGELLVKEVAFKIGYQNPSHFITAFKKRFGHTPKQYFKQEAVSHL